ncbi:MAG: VIT1/CCC1 transporter family protein [Armatimonadota bacterium]|nr:VIT1/CCC1 transporter family protein [Armatimonadota bacterium]
MTEAANLLAAWRDELDSATLYDALSDLETNTRLAEVYRRLAQAERRHAATWAEAAAEAGVRLPTFRPRWRTRVLIGLARRFGPALVLPSIAAVEDVQGGAYRASTGPGVQMAAQERSHARLLRAITEDSTGGLEGPALAKLEGRHRASSGNALRAAVLGANDGLVSVLSLVMGVAGAELPGRTILITGLAGLLAGGCSMALGEWLSVQSSRELYHHQIEIERREIETAPDEELEELTLIYQARGIAEPQARALAGQLLGDRAAALDALTREELGVDPEALGGSAWEAALASFLLFAGGAAIPVLPYVFTQGAPAVVASLVASALGLFAIGGGITLFTGRPVLRSGGRQVLFGLAAAAVTFGVGRLIGVNLSGP